MVHAVHTIHGQRNAKDAAILGPKPGQCPSPNLGMCAGPWQDALSRHDKARLAVDGEGQEPLLLSWSETKLSSSRLQPERRNQRQKSPERASCRCPGPAGLSYVEKPQTLDPAPRARAASILAGMGGRSPKSSHLVTSLKQHQLSDLVHSAAHATQTPGPSSPRRD